MTSQPWRERASSVFLDGYPLETDSARRIDAVLRGAEQHAFAVYAEVTGRRLYIPPGKDAGGKPRIDRIIVPRQPALDLGWEWGAAGIELKKSGEKVGPAVEQATDYQHCQFRLPWAWVSLDLIFLFPFELAHGFQESVMQRNNLGGAWIRPSRGSLVFTLRGKQVLELGDRGCPVREIRAGEVARKFGNQGNKIRENQ
jgi:hypothetical protein